jgi:hypothetical protein
VPALLVGDLRSAQSSISIATLILCTASLYGDPRSAQTSPGAALAVEGGAAFPDENWVRFGICDQKAGSDADNLFGSLTLFLMPLS